MISRMNGNSWLTRIQPIATVPMRERNRASAYAAGSATSTVSTAAATETCRLFQAA